MVSEQTQIKTNNQTQVFLKSGNKKRPSVLLIEDDRTTRRMVQSDIDEHCRFFGGVSANHGVALFQTHKPDLVFLDISLPDGCGHSLLNWMLSMRPEAFIVMLSGYDDRDNIWMSIEAGAKGFITKPFDPEKLMFFIRQCQNA